MMLPIDFGDNTASGPELATNGVKGRTTLFGGKDEKVGLAYGVGHRKTT
jgi:hypothetical protein